MLCEQLGMHVNLACEIAELSIASAAFMQLAAVLPTRAWGVSLSSQYLTEDAVVTTVRVIDGHARVPEGAGLGVEVEADKVNALGR